MKRSRMLEESERKNRLDVLNQARAVLRQSQQFRPSATVDKKNNNLNSQLAFKQHDEDDYWSPSGIVVDATARLHQPQYPYEGRPKGISKFHQQDDDFGLPFRDAMRRSPIAPLKKIEPRSEASSSSTTVSINTNDLNVSSDVDSTSSDAPSSRDSVASVKKVKPQKVKANAEPSAIKLTPLVTATAPTGTARTEQSPNPDTVSSVNDDASQNNVSESEHASIKKALTEKGTTLLGLVEEDDMGFSHAYLKKSDHDPHWFEKALLVRRESISEAAYKAFKHVQAVQEKTEGKGEKSLLPGKKRKPIFNNLVDPEYTADWIASDPDIPDEVSDIGEDGTEVPESELIDDDDTHPEEILTEGQDDNDNGLSLAIDLADDPDTASLIKTASELEESGVLSEITENLHTLLQITDQPDMGTHDFSRISGDADNLEVVDDEAEPLQSIFNDIFHNPEDAEDSVEKQEYLTSRKSLTPSRSQKKDNFASISVKYGGDSDYDDTFIEATTSLSTTKSASKHKSSRRTTSSTSKSYVRKQAPRDKKSSSSSNSNTLTKSKARTELNHISSSTDEKSSAITPTAKGTGEHSKSSKASSNMPNRKVPKGEHESHPSSRYQRNIHAILEKEVYQTELKKRRSHKLRQERSQERLKLAARESLERNRKSWKDPSYTEIFLPELFKYKSMSGLKAAKARKTTGVSSPGPSPINLDGPYYGFKEALQSSDQFGSAGMLAAAQVESLDIPDLVREVLASNERMYKLTIEAGREMAKVYKNKVRMKTAETQN